MYFGKNWAMMKLSFFPTILFFLLQGCAATPVPGTLFEPENPPTEMQSLLYIYRPDVPALSPRTTTIYINDEKLAVLSNESYTLVKLSPGTYRIEQMWDLWPGDFEWLKEHKIIDLTLDAGKTQFLELKVVDESLFKASWSLWVVPPSAGLARISSLKRQETESEKKLRLNY